MIDAPARLDARLAEEARALVADSATRSALAGAARWRSAGGGGWRGGAGRQCARSWPRWRRRWPRRWSATGAAAAAGRARRRPTRWSAAIRPTTWSSRRKPSRAPRHTRGRRSSSAAAWSRVEGLAPRSTRAAWTRAAVAVGLATAAAMLPWPARAVGTVAGVRTRPIARRRLATHASPLSRWSCRRRRTWAASRPSTATPPPSRSSPADDVEVRAGTTAATVRVAREGAAPLVAAADRRPGGGHAARAARWHVGDQRRLRRSLAAGRDC